MDTEKIIQPKSMSTEKVWSRVRTHFNFVLRGMASFVDVNVVNDYSYPHQSTEAALRGDWERVRDYFHHAIEQMTAEEEMRNAEEQSLNAVDEKLNNEQAARTYHSAQSKQSS